MQTFKSFETYNVKLSEIASGILKVPEEHQKAVDYFTKTIISEILLMRKDVDVEFDFNLNMGSLYFRLNKSFPFLQNDSHEFIYPLDSSESIAEVIDSTMEYATYYKPSLPIDEFKDFFENVKAFDQLFEFDGKLYEQLKKSSFSYNNMGCKDTFKDINLVRIYGANPGVSFKKDGISANVNNRCWIFDFDGVHVEINKKVFLKENALEDIKKSLICSYNLAKGENRTTLDFF